MAKSKMADGVTSQSKMADGVTSQVTYYDAVLRIARGLRKNKVPLLSLILSPAPSRVAHYVTHHVIARCFVHCAPFGVGVKVPN